MSDICELNEIRNPPRVASSAKSELPRLGFALCIFVNAMLLIRPGELYPGLASLHLYETSVLACLAIFWPRIVVAFRLHRLRQAPITICVVGLLPLVVWSLFWHGRMDLLGPYAVEFLKIVLFYLLVVVAIETPAQMRRFALALAVIITIVGTIALGHHLGIWKIDTITTLIDKRSTMEDGPAGMVHTVKMTRLMGVGIFSDPNDLAQILAVGMVLAVYGFALSRWAITKLLWTGSMLVMVAGIYYSQSRGGLMAMMAGLGMLFVSRFGVKRAIVVGALTMVPLLYVFGGHQTNMSTEDESAQARVQLWSDSMQALRDNLAFGIGPGVMDEYAGQVSHNSFLQAFAETGFPGGFLFMTAYATAIWGLLRLTARGVQITDANLAKLAPVLTAAVVAYMVGMLSLTRNYVIPTYLMLGLATVYMRIVRTTPQKEPLVWRMGLLGRSFALVVCYLLAMQLFVKAFVRWG